MSDAATILQNIETLFENGQKDIALREYKNLMHSAQEKTGEKVEMWINYAAFLHKCGQIEEAAAIAQKSIDIRPTIEGYHNLGCALRDLGKPEEAISQFRRAIGRNYNFHQSHNELGTQYTKTNQYDYAIDHLQIATTLAPEIIAYWINLSNARILAGRYQEALSALRTARKLDPQSESLWRNYGTVFNLNSKNIDLTLMLFDEVTQCLEAPIVPSDNLAGITQSMLLNQAVISAIIPQIENYRLKNFDILIQSENLNWGALCHPVFTMMLTRIFAQDISVENLLITLRYHALESLIQHKEHCIEPLNKLLPFFTALANRCFLSEYVFIETPQEAQWINALSLDTPLSVILYACYRPLFMHPDAAQIRSAFKDIEVLEPLFITQIDEPAREAEIKKSLKVLTAIDDDISILVKEQYEANPYPRWSRIAETKSHPMAKIINTVFPHIRLTPQNCTINMENPRILIAGCGTGKQSIETVKTYKDSSVLAVDISATSLAFATRKTEEFGISSIEYGLADILKLGALDEKFDIVFCGGVLHHMKDPMAGWRVLNSCLKPGGYMMIALYSDIARKAVVTAREFISERGYKADIEGIRACREEIKLLPAHHPIKPVMRWTDFYTISTCRDLLFHVQEHRFTIDKLKKSIAELELEFMGFQFTDKKALNKYYEQFPNDLNAENLDNWEIFENENPNTFTAMYQFWLRKAG